MNAEQARIPVGISSCLLGERVRYDGGRKKHSYIEYTLCDYFEFKGFRPELSIGLGFSRKIIRLTLQTAKSAVWRTMTSVKTIPAA